MGLSRNLAREAVKALAVARISDEDLAEVKRHLDAMREAVSSSTEQWLREHLNAGGSVPEQSVPQQPVPERDMAPHPTGGGRAM
ncbi:hypothetical protein SAMN04487981_118105 [Streptomyces sp. cf386]|nr:hypothetical protein SAMN04487981_118105 [Streptomyces sp. cf386]